MTAQTAHEAYELYKSAYETDTLAQGKWHTEQNGRFLACALGVLGAYVNGPRDCPASVMPRWLAQMVPWFFDNQSPEDAKSWGLAFYEQLDRLGGVVPFSVIHDWQANTVAPMAIETAVKRGVDPVNHKALAEMHFAALTGKKFTADEWRPVLKAAFKDAYANANADAYANANADAYAYAYAYANADAYAYYDRIAKLAAGMVEALKRVVV